MSVKKQYRFQRDYFHPELLRLRGPGKIQMLDGCMRMCLVPGTLSERKETAFVALRQQHDRFYVETVMEIPTDLESYE